MSRISSGDGLKVDQALWRYERYEAKLSLGFLFLLSVLGVMGVFFLSTDTASLAQVADRINYRLPPALYLYRTGSELAHCRFSSVAIHPAYVGTFRSVGPDKKARGVLGDPPFKASQ
ncbi:MAG: hypothetical protein QF879_08065 [Candidatus Latescibacteria bacterium]|nr:hypothetical protein [Candidatus Latescibacterota bacterium]